MLAFLLLKIEQIRNGDENMTKNYLKNLFKTEKKEVKRKRHLGMAVYENLEYRR